MWNYYLLLLLTRGRVLRGHTVTPRGKNPFIVQDINGVEKETPSARLTIGNVSLSFSNDEILLYVEKVPGVKKTPRSRLMDELTSKKKMNMGNCHIGRQGVDVFISMRPPNPCQKP